MLTEAGVAPQVLINDYQNASLDAATMRGLAESIVAISGSCVCCGSRDQLFDALEKAVLTERTVMLIEANGTADAAQLIELLTGDGRAVRYTLPTQVSLVDAKRWQKRHQHNWLETDQVATATQLVLSHDTEVAGPRRDDVRSAVWRLNPRASWVQSEGFAKEVIALRQSAHELPPRVLGSDGEPPPAHAQHHHKHHFASMEVRLAHGLTRAALEDFLRALPPEIIRAKGLLQLAGQRGEYTFFDYLGKARSRRAHPPARAASSASPTPPGSMPRCAPAAAIGLKCGPSGASRAMPPSSSPRANAPAGSTWAAAPFCATTTTPPTPRAPRSK